MSADGDFHRTIQAVMQRLVELSDLDSHADGLFSSYGEALAAAKIVLDEANADRERWLWGGGGEDEEPTRASHPNSDELIDAHLRWQERERKRAKREAELEWANEVLWPKVVYSTST